VAVAARRKQPLDDRVSIGGERQFAGGCAGISQPVAGGLPVAHAAAKVVQRLELAAVELGALLLFGNVRRRDLPPGVTDRDLRVAVDHREPGVKWMFERRVLGLQCREPGLDGPGIQALGQ